MHATPDLPISCRPEFRAVWSASPAYPRDMGTGDGTPDESRAKPADFEAKRQAFEDSARKVTESVTSNLLTALALFLAADLSGYLSGNGSPLALVILAAGAVLSVQVMMHVVIPAAGGLYPNGWWVGGLVALVSFTLIWLILGLGWPW